MMEISCYKGIEKLDKFKSKMKWKWLLATLVLVLAMMPLHFFVVSPVKGATVTKPLPELRVSFINVGQGDSILLETPTNKRMLVDAGTLSAGTSVVNLLTKKGIKHLDYVVATHPDADHIGGMLPVLKTFTVGKFLDSGKVHTTDTYYDMLKLIDSKKIPFSVPSAGSVIKLDNYVTVQVLYADSKANDTNDSSLVLKLTYNKVSFLLMGDADAGLETALMKKYNVQSTILKAGHHGADTSTSAAFLSKVKPQATILSYGAKNSYGHPDPDTVARLKKAKTNLYSTAISGTITVSTNGQKYTVSVKPWTGAAAVKPDPKPVPKPDLKSGTYVIPGAPKSFANCTAMRAYYPHGVKNTHPAYASKHDRDKDSWACEK